MYFPMLITHMHSGQSLNIYLNKIHLLLKTCGLYYMYGLITKKCSRRNF